MIQKTNTQPTTPTGMVDLKLPFPWKLHKLLEDSERLSNTHIVSWLPDGKGFKVHKPKEFCENVMNSYFYQTKFKSFTRQLYIYGFSKVPSGPDSGSFYHPAFLRDDLESCLSLRRNQQEDRRKKRGPAKSADKSGDGVEETQSNESSSQRVKLPTPPQFLRRPAHQDSSKKALTLFEQTFYPEEEVSESQENAEMDSDIEMVMGTDPISRLADSIFEPSEFDPFLSLDGSFSAVPLVTLDEVFRLEEKPRPIGQVSCE